MKNKSQAQEWLKRAKSNLKIAETRQSEDDILFEDLCFDCQQTVEKSLKALLIYHNIEFKWTHFIGKLVHLLESNRINVPVIIKEAIKLSNYAVSTRYPGDYEPISEEEFREALETAKKVIQWVDEKIKDVPPGEISH